MINFKICKHCGKLSGWLCRCESKPTGPVLGSVPRTITEFANLYNELTPLQFTDAVGLNEDDAWAFLRKQETLLMDARRLLNDIWNKDGASKERSNMIVSIKALDMAISAQKGHIQELRLKALNNQAE